MPHLTTGKEAMSDSVGKKTPINLTLNGEKEYKNSAFPFFPDFIIYFVNFSSEAEALVKV